MRKRGWEGRKWEREKMRKARREGVERGGAGKRILKGVGQELFFVEDNGLVWEMNLSEQCPSASLLMKERQVKECIFYKSSWMLHSSFHIISFHINWYDIISWHMISYHMISYHIIWDHIISYHNHVILYHNHVIVYHNHVILYHNYVTSF